jgi:hypothetical protein
LQDGPFHAARIAAFFLEFLDAGKIAHGYAAGFFGIHACGDIFLDLSLDMKTQLRAKFLFDCISSEQ